MQSYNLVSKTYLFQRKLWFQDSNSNSISPKMTLNSAADTQPLEVTEMSSNVFVGSEAASSRGTGGGSLSR